MSDYDKIFVGTGPVSVVDAFLDAKAGQNILLIDERDAVGGAWGTIPVGDYGKLEIGCHIWSYHKAAYAFMRDFFQLNLIEMDPQPYFIKGRTRLSYDQKNGLVTLKRSLGYLKRFDFKGLRDFAGNNPSARIPIFAKKYLYPQGGARDVQNALVQKINQSGIETQLNLKIVEVRKKDDFWELEDASGHVLTAKSIRLTSTSSVKKVVCGGRSYVIPHRLVNYSHYHLVIQGKLLKPCPYIRILGNDTIHRLCDITYQLENQKNQDCTVLLVGYFDNDSHDFTQDEILTNIQNFLIEHQFVKSDVQINYAQSNRFTTSYIPNELREELDRLDDSIEILHTTDLMYGIHYKLAEWQKRLKA